MNAISTKLSTKARYGLKACFILGLEGNNPIAVAELSRRCDLSEKYLEQLFAILKKSGVVTSTRGSQGGYVLAKSPEDTTVGAVLDALEDGIKLSDCENGCSDKYCPNRNIFTRIQKDIDKVLYSTTIKDMIDDYKCKSNNTTTEDIL